VNDSLREDEPASCTPRLALIDDDTFEFEALRRAWPRSTDAKVTHRHFRASSAFFDACEGEGYVPNLILLDISISGEDGFDVLKRLKQHPVVAPVPVLMWSNSTNPEEIERSYQLGASAYVPKPMDYQGLKGLLGHMAGFWFTGAALVAGTASGS